MDLASLVEKAREDAREDARQGAKDPQQDIKKRWYKKRYQLFSKFDEGIRVSDSMWFSVTPEQVAKSVAASLRAGYPDAEAVVDVCGGAGGNSIAFSQSGLKTVYVDIDPSVCQDAAHNSRIYGCLDIDFHVDDFNAIDLEELVDEPSKTVVHASPEWGGPGYKDVATFDLDNCVPTCKQIVDKCRSQGIDNIMLYLPKNSDLQQLSNLGCTRVDNINVNGRSLALLAYWEAPKRSKKRAGEEDKKATKKRQKNDLERSP